MKQLFPKIVAVMVSLFVALLFAEIVLRLVGGYSLNFGKLPERIPVTYVGRDFLTGEAKKIAANEHINPTWINDPYHPLPFSDSTMGDLGLFLKKAEAWWNKGEYDIGGNLIKAWNRNYLFDRYILFSELDKEIVEEKHQRKQAINSMIANDLWPERLERGRDSIMVFARQKPLTEPRFRYPKHLVIRESGCRFNNFGFRGNDIELQKPKRVIRIAFAGASTTQQSLLQSFSYSELVETWLNKWVKNKGLDIEFQTLNVAREGQSIVDIATVVADELLPFEPDLLVYYEGNNDFRALFELIPIGDKYHGQKAKKNFRLSDYSALALRLKRLFGKVSNEPAKPNYQISWPEQIDHFSPIPYNQGHLPKTKLIVSHLDSIRTSIESIGGELIMCSFVMLVHDGLMLNSERHKSIIDFLENKFWPYRYKDVRMMMDWQNALFENYARANELEFFDIAAGFPLIPDLFMDGIHRTNEGIRIHAWMVFNYLLPIIKRKLASGDLPRPTQFDYEFHPVLDVEKPYKIAVSDLPEINIP